MLFEIIQSRKLLNKPMMNFITCLFNNTKLPTRCVVTITAMLLYC